MRFRARVSPHVCGWIAKGVSMALRTHDGNALSGRLQPAWVAQPRLEAGPSFCALRQAYAA